MHMSTSSDDKKKKSDCARTIAQWRELLNHCKRDFGLIVRRAVRAIANHRTIAEDSLEVT
jgi:hypothetical protein